MKKKSPLNACLSMLLSFTLLLTFSSAAPAHAALSWDVQTVDNHAYGYGNGYSPILVDSNNAPHIAYTDVRIEANRFQTPLVMYASWNGTEWDSEQIALGFAFDLLIDSSNNPHILYGGYSGHKGLIYASWTGSGWSTQTLDKSEDIPFRTTIVIGKNNVIYLMYGYTTKHGSGSYWESQSVKLAINENDENTNWKTETVVSDITNYSNMILDTQNFPHFAYQVQARGYPWISNISYASWDGSGWSTQTIVSNVSLKVDFVNINMGGLALDAYGYPHLNYVTSEPNSDLCSVMYASWTGIDWDIQQVDSTHIANGPCYLSLDSNRNPHISYLITPSGVGIDSYIASIMYATATEAAPLPSPTNYTGVCLTEQEVIIIVAIAVAGIGAGLGLLIYLIKRR